MVDAAHERLLKASGLDQVPDQWRLLRLKHIASVTSSNVDKKTEEGEIPVRLCNYVDVYYHDRITPDIEFMQASASAAEILKFRLQHRDILITKDSESWDDIAVPTFVTQDFDDVLCGYHLALIRPNPAFVDGRFLYYCFAARAVNWQFEVAANGITRFGLPLSTIGDAIFPVPPLDEQSSIADYLDEKMHAIDLLLATAAISRADESQNGLIGQQVQLLREYRKSLTSAAVLASVGVLNGSGA